MRGEVNPKLPIPIGWHLQPGYGDAFDTCFVQRMTSALAPVATRSISKLKDGIMAPCAIITIGTRRTIVAFGADAEKSTPCGGFSSSGMFCNPWKTEQIRCWIPTDRGNAGRWRLSVGLSNDGRQAGLADHHL